MHEPFSSRGHGELANAGVLISHGFTGSPESIRDWAQSFAAAGFAVEAPLLPGHGTRWQDLAHTGWQQWYTEVEKAYFSLASRCSVVFAAGLSMGGTLCLRLAAKHDVGGLALVNPFMVASRPAMRIAGLLAPVVPSTAPVADDIVKPGVTEHAYERTPTAAVAQLNQLIKSTRPLLPEVTAPVQFFRSAVDHVVTEASVDAIRSGVSSPTIDFRRLNNSYHVATLDHDADLIFDSSVGFFSTLARERFTADRSS